MLERQLVASIALQGPDLPGRCTGAAVEADDIQSIPYTDYRGVRTWDPLGAPLKLVWCDRCDEIVEMTLGPHGPETAPHRPARTGKP